MARRMSSRWAFASALTARRSRLEVMAWAPQRNGAICRPTRESLWWSTICRASIPGLRAESRSVGEPNCTQRAGRNSALAGMPLGSASCRGGSSVGASRVLLSRQVVEAPAQLEGFRREAALGLFRNSVAIGGLLWTRTSNSALRQSRDGARWGGASPFRVRGPLDHREYVPVR